MESENKKSIWGKYKFAFIATPITIILCIASIWGWILYRQYQEEIEYRKLSDNVDINLYERFLDNYPNSIHYSEVHDTYVNLREEVKDWKAVATTRNAAELEMFIASHPESSFEKEAKLRIDSLLWSQAIQSRNIELFNDYIVRVPEGLHISEAQEVIRKHELNTLSTDEEYQVKNVITSFITALGRRDKESAIGYIGDQIKFMGKNVNRGQMMKWIEGFFGEDVYNVRTNVIDLNINKSIGENDVITYIVTFNCDLFFNRYDPDKATYQERRGSATLTPEFKVKTFVWNVVSSQK